MFQRVNDTGLSQRPPGLYVTALVELRYERSYQSDEYTADRSSEQSVSQLAFYPGRATHSPKRYLYDSFKQASLALESSSRSAYHPSSPDLATLPFIFLFFLLIHLQKPTKISHRRRYRRRANLVARLERSAGAVAAVFSQDALT